MTNIKLAFVTLLMLISRSQSEKINDIHILISNIQEYGALMETSLRAQFNTFHNDKIKTISNLLTSLKNLQNTMPTDLNKYDGIDTGMNIFHSSNELWISIKKNVVYSVKSSMDDAKISQSNILYDFIMYINDFIDKVALGSKNLFNDGKGCVMEMEKEFKDFIDLGSSKFMECLRTSLTKKPINPQKYTTFVNAASVPIQAIVYKLKEPFWYIWAYSTQQQNDTAAEKFNTVSLKIENFALNSAT